MVTSNDAKIMGNARIQKLFLGPLKFWLTNLGWPHFQYRAINRGHLALYEYCSRCLYGLLIMSSSVIPPCAFTSVQAEMEMSS